MKRNLIAGLMVVIVLIAGGVYLLAGGKDNSTDMSNMDMSSTSNKSPASNQSNSTSAEATNFVSIQNFAFSPANITVKTGTKVTWTNEDSTAHTVTETDGQSGPNSDDLGQGQSYGFTFTRAGTYHYHCSIHPEMVGSVKVTE